MPTTPLRALIVGAGDLGLGLAETLLAVGNQVYTLNRSGRSVPGASPIVADLTDAATLAGLPAVDLVVFTTAPPGRTETDYLLAYRDGPARVMGALPRDPARVILVSTSGVIGTDDGSWVDETTDAAPTRPTAEIVRKGEEWLAERCSATAVRPTGIYGPGRRSLLDRVRRGEAAIAADGTPRWTNRIHRDDVVAALAIVATHKAPPPVLVATDDEPAMKDTVITHLATRLEAPSPPTITVDRVSGKRCRNDLLRSLGWAPAFPGFVAGYEDVLRGEASTPAEDQPGAQPPQPQ
jgi:nucleoside-diphosphate-sugar epimerase